MAETENNKKGGLEDMVLSPRSSLVRNIGVISSFVSTVKERASSKSPKRLNGQEYLLPLITGSDQNNKIPQKSKKNVANNDLIDILSINMTSSSRTVENERGEKLTETRTMCETVLSPRSEASKIIAEKNNEIKRLENEKMEMMNYLKSFSLKEKYKVENVQIVEPNLKSYEENVRGRLINESLSKDAKKFKLERISFDPTYNTSDIDVRNKSKLPPSPVAKFQKLLSQIQEKEPQRVEEFKADVQDLIKETKIFEDKMEELQTSKSILMDKISCLETERESIIHGKQEAISLLQSEKKNIYDKYSSLRYKYDYIVKEENNKAVIKHSVKQERYMKKNYVAKGVRQLSNFCTTTVSIFPLGARIFIFTTLLPLFTLNVIIYQLFATCDFVFNRHSSIYKGRRDAKERSKGFIHCANDDSLSFYLLNWYDYLDLVAYSIYSFCFNVNVINKQICSKESIFDELLKRESTKYQQVVVLGGNGCTTRLHRMEERKNTSLFEVDNILLQQEKLQNIPNMFINQSVNIVSINKENESWSDKLFERGFLENKKTLILLNTSNFTPLDSVFSFVSKYCFPESRIVFEMFEEECDEYDTNNNKMNVYKSSFFSFTQKILKMGSCKKKVKLPQNNNAIAMSKKELREILKVNRFVLDKKISSASYKFDKNRTNLSFMKNLDDKDILSNIFITSATRE